MALFVLYKFILQIHMRSHPVGLDVRFLVGPFVYFILYVSEQQRLWRDCAGSPEPSLVTHAISTKMSWAGSFIVFFSGILIFRIFRYTTIMRKFCWTHEGGNPKAVFETERVRPTEEWNLGYFWMSPAHNTVWEFSWASDVGTFQFSRRWRQVQVGVEVFVVLLVNLKWGT